MGRETLKYDIKKEENETIIKVWVDYPFKLGFEYIIPHEIIIEDIIKIIDTINTLKSSQKKVLETVSCSNCDELVSDKSSTFCLKKGEDIGGEDYYKLASNCEFFTGRDVDV